MVKLYKLLISWEFSSTLSIKMFILCLLTCPAYLVAFRMDLTCTKVSCCVNWVSISWFTCCLILLTSFVVVVPVSHLRALLRRAIGYFYDKYCCVCVHQMKNPCLKDPGVVIVSEWVLQVSDLEIVVVDVFYQVVCWNTSNGVPSAPVIHVQ